MCKTFTCFFSDACSNKHLFNETNKKQIIKLKKHKLILKLVRHLQPCHERAWLINHSWILKRRLRQNVRVLGPFLCIQPLKTDAEIHQIVERDLVKHLRLERVATRGKHCL